MVSSIGLDENTYLLMQRAGEPLLLLSESIYLLKNFWYNGVLYDRKGLFRLEWGFVRQIIRFFSGKSKEKQALTQ